MAYWTDIKVSALGSTVGWTLARKEQTNDPIQYMVPWTHKSSPNEVSISSAASAQLTSVPTHRQTDTQT